MILIIIAIVALLASSHPPSQSSSSYAGQLLSYNGTSLSSVANVIENAISGTQYINASTYHLSIYGLVNQSMQLTYNDVITKQSYLEIVPIRCVEGWSATILWQGVLVTDLIAEAGALPSANTVIFHASDGYTTALPISYLEDNHVLLAFKMNNITITADRGFPFMLVAQGQYGYKWIKWVTGIELSNDSNYLGYWESRGYPNNASIG